MTDTVQLMEDRLARAKASKQKVHVYLVNGIKIEGFVRAFDSETIALGRSSDDQDKVEPTLINRCNLTTVQAPEGRDNR